MHIVHIIGPVFALIAFGAILRKIKFLQGNEVNVLNKITFYVALPSLILYNVIVADAEEILNMPLIIGMYVAMVIMLILSYLVGTILKLDCSKKAVVVMSSFRCNMAYMGLPIIASAFGDEVISKTSIAIGFLSPGVFILSVLAAELCNIGDFEGENKWVGFIKEIGVSLVKTPMVVVSFLAIIISSLNITIPSLLMESLGGLSQMAFPIALLGVGASISMERLKGDIFVTGLIALWKLFVLSLIGYVVLRWLGVSGVDLSIGVLLLAMPTAIVTYVIADSLGADRKLAASGIVMTTVMSIVTISIWLMILV